MARTISQKLSESPTEYEMNSNQKNGKNHSDKNNTSGGMPWADPTMLSAARTNPVLYITMKPRIHPTTGINIIKQMNRLFPNMYSIVTLFRS